MAPEENLVGAASPGTPQVALLTTNQLDPCLVRRSEVSAKEKLVGYIIKNPPEEKLSKAEKK